MGSLRVLLALAVVITHSGPVFGWIVTGGLVAVETFFIISGFYMSLILDTKYRGKGSYSLFLTNRFLRLYPMYYVVVLATILISIGLYIFSDRWFRLSNYVHYFDTASPDTIIFLVFANLALLGQDIAMFLGFDPDSGSLYFTSDFRSSYPRVFRFLFIPPAWSLGIEVTFYLMAPFIVRKRTSLILLLILLSSSIRLYTYACFGIRDPWFYRFFPSEIALFLMGIISYRLYAIYEIHNTTIIGHKLAAPIAASFLLTVVFYQFLPRFHLGHLFNWAYYLFCCFSIPFLFHLSKSSRLDARIGELSYPMYITHILIISFVWRFLSTTGWQDYKGECSVLVTVFVSYLLIRWVSDPIEKIRRARVDRGTKTHETAEPQRSDATSNQGR